MAETTLHATCVALEGRGVLITGASGSGKSALALELISRGAALVADDRTVLSRREGQLWAAPPPTIAGLIEARHVGILRMTHLGRCAVALVIDMDIAESARLPPQRSIAILDIERPLLHKVESSYFPAAIHAYLTGSGFETT